jgi:hypothetical protein
MMETLRARPFPASLEGLVLSIFDRVGGLFALLLLLLLLTEMVVEEEEEDRDEGLSRVGMMRTMTTNWASQAAGQALPTVRAVIDRRRGPPE